MKALAAVLAIAAVGLLTRPAGAQPSADEAALRHFQSATALFEAGDYELALTEFQAAYDAKPHPTVLRNVAATQERLRRYPDAIRTLERYLTEATSPAFRAERAAIAAHLVGLRSLVGRIEVVLPEPGFSIEVDGRSVGTSPLTEPVEVPLGTRTVVARRDGWEPATAEVQVAGGATSSVEIQPIARMARLTVDTAAPHATVSVDDSPAMAAPWSNAVLPGRHSVRVAAPGRRLASLRVDLAPGAERSMVVQLEAGGPQGLLSIEAVPRQGARATVDGVPADLGVRAARSVEQGQHRIVVDGPDHAAYVANVRVTASRMTRVRVRLDEDRFWVSPLWGTIAATGAAVTLAASIYWGSQALSTANEYRDEGTPAQELPGLYDERLRLAQRADVAALFTVLFSAGAAALWYLSGRRPESTARITTGAIE